MSGLPAVVTVPRTSIRSFTPTVCPAPVSSDSETKALSSCARSSGVLTRVSSISCSRATRIVAVIGSASRSTIRVGTLNGAR